MWKKGAICFSGEVHSGEEFRRPLNSHLVFVVQLPGGIDVIPYSSEATCLLSSWVSNPPVRAHHETEIDAKNQWTAEDEVEDSTRIFRFPTNCEDYQKLYDIIESDSSKYFDNIEKLAKGEGRLWITESKVTHAHDTGEDKSGEVEWIRFNVEIRLPKLNE